VSRSLEDVSPQVVAAIIASTVAFISIISTVIVARWGFTTTMRAAKMAADEAHKDTERALTEQREQLDKTLTAQHIRTLNERFVTAATQLGGDKASAVRLAGVYAMASLADDWEENRQQCIDVLCAYMRLPYEPRPGDDASTADQAAWRRDQLVRHTVVRVITSHLRTVTESALVSWCGMNFDFTGVVFDGGDFSNAEFAGGRVSFVEAVFADDVVYFTGARFTGGRVSFDGARFAGGWANFQNCRFSSDSVGDAMSSKDIKHQNSPSVLERNYTAGEPPLGAVSFIGAQCISGGIDFGQAIFDSDTVDFRAARFDDFHVGFGDTVLNGGSISFEEAQFTGDALHFERAKLNTGNIDFSYTRFYGKDCIAYFSSTEFAGASVRFQDVKFAAPCFIDFTDTRFLRGVIDFSGSRFAGSKVSFRNAQFSGSSIIFANTEYYDGPGIFFHGAQLKAGSLDYARAKFFDGTMDFSNAYFGGCTLDFSEVEEWRQPPIFPDTDQVLQGLILPTE
jgi:uncharacterized protein YjbI with pentapeptide repeats